MNRLKRIFMHNFHPGDQSCVSLVTKYHMSFGNHMLKGMFGYFINILKGTCVSR